MLCPRPVGFLVNRGLDWKAEWNALALTVIFVAFRDNGTGLVAARSHAKNYVTRQSKAVAKKGAVNRKTAICSPDDRLKWILCCEEGLDFGVKVELVAPLLGGA